MIHDLKTPVPPPELPSAESLILPAEFIKLR